MNNNTSENNPVVFKTALNGYRRDDVNDYIIAMSKRFKESEESYRETIDLLRRRIDEENAQHRTELAARADELSAQSARTNELVAAEAARAEKAEADAEAVRSELAEAQRRELAAKQMADVLEGRIAEADARAAEYEEELARQKQLADAALKRAAEAEAAYATLKESVEAIPERCGDGDDLETLRDELTAKNAQLTELRDILAQSGDTADCYGIGAKIGSIISSAGAVADGLISRAKAEAAELREKNERESAYICEYLAGASDSVLKSVTDDISEAADDYMREIASSAALLLGQTTQLIDALESKKQTYNDKLREYGDKALTDMEERIRVLSEKLTAEESAGRDDALCNDDCASCDKECDGCEAVLDDCDSICAEAAADA